MHDSLKSDRPLDLIPTHPEDEAILSDVRTQPNIPCFLVDAYRQTGPIFRAWTEGKMWVVMAGPEANQFVWNNTELWNYPVMFPGFLDQMGPDHLNNLEGKEHTHKRAMLRPGMDRPAVMRHLPGYNHWFGAELERKAGSAPLDLIEFWANTITKANTKTVTQVDLSDEEIERLTTWEDQMLSGLGLGEARHAYYARSEYLTLKAEAMALMGRMVDERLADPTRWNDAYTDVLRARNQQEGGHPERYCLVDDLYYLLVAGVHNTARWINLILLQLHFSPEWQNRVRGELEAWDGRDVMAVGGMASLKAIIMEIQRLRPIVHFTRRNAAQDFEFGGYNVPAGTNILMANSCCHFLEEFYDDPFSFRPERFLDGGKFAPRTNGFFGGGVHICVGRNFSMLQAPLAVAGMLKFYEIKYANETEMKLLAEETGRSLPTSVAASFRRRE